MLSSRGRMASTALAVAALGALCAPMTAAYAEPADVPTTEVSLSAEPTGSFELPYFDGKGDDSGGVLRAPGGGEVPYGGKDPLRVQRVSGGYVVATSASVVKIADDGTTTELASADRVLGFDIDAAGKRVAIGSQDAERVRTIEVLDLATGEQEDVSPKLDAWGEVTFTGDDVVMAAADPVSGKAQRWTPGTDDVSELKATTEITAHSQAAGLAAAYNGTFDDGSRQCDEVRDTSGSVLWESCDLTVTDFSDDGKYAVAIDTVPYESDALPDTVTVLDARTGEALHTYATDYTGQAAFDAAGRVVLEENEDDQQAMVVANAEGDYETATAPKKAPNLGEGTPPQPYVLAGDD